MDGFLHLFFPASAVKLADDHAGTGGKTNKQTDEHIDHRANSTHGGVGFVIDEVAYHPGVYGVIKLLKNVAHQQGQGKGNDMAGNATLGHIHIPFSLF